jgi:hypothetical protein
MLILFDHGTPRGLARRLTNHKVIPAKQMGWDTLANGSLLKAAEAENFDLLLTTDQNIRYQQNLASRKIAILVISGSTNWAHVRLHVDRLVAAVETASSGSYEEVFIPFE